MIVSSENREMSDNFIPLSAYSPDELYQLNISIVFGHKRMSSSSTATKPKYEDRQFIRLWESTAPGSRGIDESIPGPHTPTLQFFAPSSSNVNEFKMKTVVLVLPGGGYSYLAPYEEVTPCEWLSSAGYICYALRYRIGPTYKLPAPMIDLDRALKLIRTLHPLAKIGTLGFSAGGHLSCFANDIDFRILAYPVIDYRDVWQVRCHNAGLLCDTQ
jgi:acetyl esterase/lipase